MVVVLGENGGIFVDIGEKSPIKWLNFTRFLSEDWRRAGPSRLLSVPGLVSI